MIESSLLGIQFIGMLFGVFMIYITFLHQRRKEFTIKESVFFFSAWIFLMIIAIFPTSLDFFVLDVLKISRRLDFFIILGIIFIVGLLFHIYTVMRTTQNKVENLVREIAIRDAKEKSRK